MGGSEGEETKEAAGGGTGELLLLARERESIEEDEGEEAGNGGEMGGEVASSELATCLGAVDPALVALLWTYTFNSLPSNSALGAAELTPLPKLTSFSKCPPSAP